MGSGVLPFRYRGALAALLGAAAICALPAAASDARPLEDSLAECGAIQDNAARLVCVDAILSAMKRNQAAKAETEALRVEADRRLAEAEAKEAAATARIAEAEARIEAAARMEAELAKAAQEAAVAQRIRAQAQASTSPKDTQLAAADPSPVRILQGGRMPESTIELFGALDLSQDALTELLDGKDLDTIYSGDELDSITAPVAKSGHTNTGKLYVVLEDGALWRQKGSARMRLYGDGPQTVEIKRGLFGSFTMRIDGKGRTIKVERIR